MSGKIIVISAPSGAGKSTIINELLDAGAIDVQFSVSATNRDPRPGEVNGESYHFLSTEQFQDAIANGEFVEWEEVYPGRYYGTLKSEVSNKSNKGYNILLDIDVKGAINVKQQFGAIAKTIFIMPPSIEELQKRLQHRGTEDAHSISQRIEKAEYEISFAPQFDAIIVNDDLPVAIERTRQEINDFLGK